MRVARRIFHLIGVEGKSIHAVKVVLERDRIPSHGGAPYWNKTFIRKCILDDVYRPHTFEEIEALVSSDVAARLLGDGVVTARCDGCGTYFIPREMEEVSPGGRYNAHSGTCKTCVEDGRLAHRSVVGAHDGGKQVKPINMGNW